MSATALIERSSGPSLVFVKTKARSGEAYPDRPAEGVPYILPVVRVLQSFSERPTGAELAVSHEGEASTELVQIESGGVELAYSNTWQPEGKTLPAIRHNEKLYLSYHNQAFFCGFRLDYSEWSSTTISGDLVMTRVPVAPSWDGTAPGLDRWGIQFEQTITGTGRAIITGRASIAGAVEGIDDAGWMLKATGLNPNFPGATGPFPKRFWIGCPAGQPIFGGFGVCYDRTLAEIQLVSLTNTGDIDSALAAQPCSDPTDEEISLRFAWEIFSNGDRYTVGHGGDGGFSTVVYAHVPGSTMPRDNFDVVIGIETDDELDDDAVTGEVVCHGQYDCQLCDDMPTPDEPTIDGTTAITFAARPDGLTPASVLLPDFLGAIGSQFDPSGLAGVDGVRWVSSCRWQKSAEAILPAMGSHTYVKEEVFAYLKAGSPETAPSLFTSYAGCGAPAGSDPGDVYNGQNISATWCMSLFYRITYGVFGVYTYMDCHMAIYTLDEDLDCIGDNVFTKVLAGHDPRTHFNSSQQYICGFPWIDPTSWPDELTVRFP